MHVHVCIYPTCIYMPFVKYFVIVFKCSTQTEFVSKLLLSATIMQSFLFNLRQLKCSLCGQKYWHNLTLVIF